jgi:hypothetical protein
MSANTKVPKPEAGGAQEYQRKEMKMEAGYRARTYFSGCGIRATHRNFEAISEEKKDERRNCTVNAIL